MNNNTEIMLFCAAFILWLALAGCATPPRFGQDFAAGMAAGMGYSLPARAQVRQGAQLRFNPFDGSYHYAPANAQLRYNPFTDSYEWAQ